jgi:hypothetical protein
MSRHTWACFACRAAVRRESVSPARCPSCAKPCERLGTKIPVPPKDDAKAWRQVEAHFRKVSREKTLLLEERQRHEKRVLRAQLAKLEALPENAGRRKAAALIRKELEDLR